MRTLLFIFSFQIILFANIFDDINLFKGQVEYKNKNYKESLKLYNKISKKTDNIHYNIGNILYKQKEYKKALVEYKKINSIKLNYKKFHNIANCYVALNQLDMAIAFYKSALKFQNSKTTKYNLLLALEIQKKIIEEKQKEIDKQKRKDITPLANVGKNRMDSFKNDSKSDKTSANKEKKDILYKSNNISNLKSKSVLEDIQNIKPIDIKSDKKSSVTKPILSDIEENKWNKTLSDKKINTLLIPLDNKGIKNEIYPW